MSDWDAGRYWFASVVQRDKSSLLSVPVEAQLDSSLWELPASVCGPFLAVDGFTCLSSTEGLVLFRPEVGLAWLVGPRDGDARPRPIDSWKAIRRSVNVGRAELPDFDAWGPGRGAYPFMRY